MPKSFQIKLVLKGLVMAVIAALLLALIFGILISFTSLTDTDLSFTIIYGISIFSGGFIAANQAGTKGIYYGIAIGMAFVILLILLSAIFSPVSPSWVGIGEKLLYGILAGGIGGIIGVILKR